MKQFNNTFKVRFAVLVLQMLMTLLGATTPANRALKIAGENFIRDILEV